MAQDQGLSPLQQTILRIAYDNRRQEGRTAQSPGADCYYYEVVQQVWKFENRWAGMAQRTQERWHFRQRPLGARYRAALVSVSRSVRRLVERGLVTHQRGKAWRGTWAGVKLTDGGVPVAKDRWEV